MNVDMNVQERKPSTINWALIGIAVGGGLLACCCCVWILLCVFRRDDDEEEERPLQSPPSKLPLLALHTHRIHPEDDPDLTRFTQLKPTDETRYRRTAPQTSRAAIHRSSSFKQRPRGTTTTIPVRQTSTDQSNPSRRRYNRV